MYGLLDTLASYWPSLLWPADVVDDEEEGSPSLGPSDAHGAQASAERVVPVPLRAPIDTSFKAWVAGLVDWMLPETAPGLTRPLFELRSCVPRRVRLALLLGHGTARDDVDTYVGAKLAATAGRVLVADAAVRHGRRRPPPDEVPAFHPDAYPILDALYAYSAPLEGTPLPLWPVLAHVVQSMGRDAIAQINTPAPNWAAWELAWRPALHAWSRLVVRLPPAPWDDVFPHLLRPLCHLATIDGVSDLLSAQVLQVLVRLVRHWARCDAVDTPRLASCALEMQESLLLSGTPSLPIYAGVLDLHMALAEAGDRAATAPMTAMPFPFLMLAAPPAMAGSVALLDRLCEHVLRLRQQVQRGDGAQDARAVDDMATALVDLIWSGRAFATWLQRGLRFGDDLACDRGTLAAWKQACDALRVVPFVLVGSLSHGAVLAPLFEKFCHEVLAPGYAVHAPITPSALRGARGVRVETHADLCAGGPAVRRDPPAAPRMAHAARRLVHRASAARPRALIATRS